MNLFRKPKPPATPLAPPTLEARVLAVPGLSAQQALTVIALINDYQSAAYYRGQRDMAQQAALFCEWRWRADPDDSSRKLAGNWLAGEIRKLNLQVWEPQK
jgi:hypothetical protein